MLKHKVEFYFFGNLNDFLSEEKKNKNFIHVFKGRASIKNLIESIGVPHTEVAFITVNKKRVNFNYLVKDNDIIAIYPFNYGIYFFINKIVSFFKSKNLKFILDVHLGKLAKYLRLCGFDVLYNFKWNDNEIIEKSIKENRIILTHDKGLLMNKKVIKGYFVRSLDPEEQLVEIIQRFLLLRKIKLFSRCLDCNNKLKRISRKEVIGKVERFIYEKYRKFFYCEVCNKIYWKGPHYKNMKCFIKKIKSKLYLLKRFYL